MVDLRRGAEQPALLGTGVAAQTGVRSAGRPVAGTYRCNERGRAGVTPRGDGLHVRVLAEPLQQFDCGRQLRKQIQAELPARDQCRQIHRVEEHDVGQAEAVAGDKWREPAMTLERCDTGQQFFTFQRIFSTPWSSE